MRSGQPTFSIIYSCLILLLMAPAFTHAQEQWYHVRDVKISGHKHTKEFVVLREMQIKKGDSIRASDLNAELEAARQHIYNTVLFVKVYVEAGFLDSTNILVNVILEERWYIFPIPDINLVDRSFNEWWVKHHADLNRLNYGINFFHNNLRGRSDPLKIYLNGGYTPTIAFSYSHPYSNHRLSRGFTTGVGYTQQREVGYRTSYNNEIEFYRKDNFVSKAWNARIGYIIRNGLRKKETILLGYLWTKVDDSVVIKNPNYFNQPGTSKGVPEFSYQLQYFDVDNIIYPLTGSIYELMIHKQGLKLKGGLNFFSLVGGYKWFGTLGKKWNFSMQFLAECKLPFKQAYVNQKALGFENYLRGLEYYVVDGVAYSLSIFDIKRDLVHFSIPTFIRSKPYRRMPFRIYAKAYMDIGYSYLKTNPGRLNNKFLHGKGFGLDVVTFHDLHLKIEYSFNQLGQNGLFLHNQSGL